MIWHMICLGAGGLCTMLVLNQPTLPLYMLLQTADGRKAVPLALVGSGLGGDCAPKAANFRQVYRQCHTVFSM